MRKILIVDDEILIRMGFRAILDWETYGYTVVGEAENGSEALKKIKALSPDLVFTDLRMDEIDGFSLIEACNQLYPHIKCVVLSSYNDFENVRKAMKLGAVDYIFKMEAQPAQLIELLGELQWNDAPNLVLQNNLRSVQASLIRRGVFGEYQEQASFLQEFAAVSLPNDFLHFRLMTIALNNYSALRKLANGSVPILPLENLLKDELAAQYGATLYPFSDEQMLLLLPCAEGDESMRQMAELQKDYEKVHAQVKRYFEISMTAVVSLPHSGVDELNCAFKENEESLRYRYMLETDRIHSYHPPQENKSLELPAHLALSALEKSLTEGPDAVQNYYDTLFAFYGKCRCFTLEQIREHLQQRYQLMDRYLQARAPQLAGWKNAHQLSLAQAIVLYDQLSAVKEAFDAYLEAYNTYMGKQRIHRDIEETLAYAKAHLSEELSIAKVAGHINMSESYFSHLFKREMRLSFVDWLNQERMDRAMLLLQTTSDRVADIGMQVGFDSPNYFRTLFKKMTGMTPLEARQSSKKQNSKITQQD